MCLSRILLLPPSLRDWLPEGHLAYFVSDLVDHLDLSAITAVYRGRPRDSAVPPLMMTKVLLYAYCVRVFSSRKIQRRLVEDVAFLVLAADNRPNFRSPSTLGTNSHGWASPTAPRSTTSLSVTGHRALHPHAEGAVPCGSVASRRSPRPARSSAPSSGATTRSGSSNGWTIGPRPSPASSWWR